MAEFKRLPKGYAIGDFGRPACPECGKLLSKKEIEEQECSKCDGVGNPNVA